MREKEKTKSTAKKILIAAISVCLFIIITVCVCLISGSAQVSERFFGLTVNILLIAIVSAAAALCVFVFVLLFGCADRSDLKAKTNEEFLSGVSHEIKTPLSAIIGLDHLMAVHKGDKEKFEIYLKKNSDTAQYLFDLVNDILDMSKLRGGKIDLAEEPVHLDEIAESVCAIQKENIEGAGNTLVVNKNIGFPLLWGDEMRIKRVLLNFIGSAAKFTRNGKITLDISQENTGKDNIVTIIKIFNEKDGISEEFKNRVSEAFAYKDGEYDLSGERLGMAVSCRIIREMGGSVSTKEGLAVTLPMRICEADESKADPAENPEKSPSDFAKQSSINILMAEDDDLNAEIQEEILKEYGFAVERAENGLKALEIFKRSKVGHFNAILMDIQMPIMNGYNATEAIRDLDRDDAKAIPIFACTANTFTDDKKKAEEAGMNGFITKPIEPSQIAEKLSGIKKTRDN